MARKAEKLMALSFGQVVSKRPKRGLSARGGTMIDVIAIVNKLSDFSLKFLRRKPTGVLVAHVALAARSNEFIHVDD